LNPNRVRLALLILLVSLLSWAGCGDENGVGVDNTDFVAERSFRFRFDAGDWSRLGLQGVNGDIHVVEAAGSDSIVVAGVRRVRSESLDDAEEHLQSVQVSVQDLSSEILVRTDQPDDSNGRCYEVDYDIYLPDGVDVEVTGVNGRIVLQGVEGSAVAHLVNGQVEADVKIPSGGTVAIDVVNGAIELRLPEATSAGFTATIVNGSIGLAGLVLHDPASTAYSLTGTLGDGDGTISLAVVNGNIGVGLLE
jgi:hypothetical protein